MVITALIIMSMKIMETDLHDARPRHLLMEYQIMDPSPDSLGTIKKAKTDVFEGGVNFKIISKLFISGRSSLWQLFNAEGNFW